MGTMVDRSHPAVRGATTTLRVLAVVFVSTSLLGCVPTPAAASGSPRAATAVVPTLEPTPAGPTPTPSFIRPTPTPLPTFLVYVVQPGDSLEGIGDRFGTSGRSIAHWNRFRYPSLDPLSDDYEPDRIVVGWMLRLIPGLEYDPEDMPEPSG